MSGAHVKVDPTSLVSDGDELYSVAATLLGSIQSAVSNLSSSSGMAGDDNSAEDFAEFYDEQAPKVLEGAAGMVKALHGLDYALQQTAAAYKQAEMVGALKSGSPGITPSEASVYASTSLPSCLGPGLPGQLGEFQEMLEDALAALGVVIPTGDPGKLRSAAGQWTSLESALTTAQSSTSSALTGMSATDIPQRPDILGSRDAVAEKLGKLAGNAGAMSTACTDFAEGIDKTREELMWMVGQMVAEIMVEIGISLALSFLTGGIAALAGAAKVTSTIARWAVKIAQLIQRLRQWVQRTKAWLRGLIKAVSEGAQSAVASVTVQASVNTIRAGDEGFTQQGLLSTGLSSFVGASVSSPVGNRIAGANPSVLRNATAGSVEGVVDGVSSEFTTFAMDGFKGDFNPMSSMVAGAVLGGAMRPVLDRGSRSTPDAPSTDTPDVSPVDVPSNSAGDVGTVDLGPVEVSTVSTAPSPGGNGNGATTGAEGSTANVETDGSIPEPGVADGSSTTAEGPAVDIPAGDAPSGGAAGDSPSVPDSSVSVELPSVDAPSAGDAPSVVDAPSVDAPTADAPSVDAPSVDAPSADAPSVDAPSVDWPSTGAPSVDAPSVDAPSVDAPSADAPSVDAPSVDAPGADAPSVDAPSVDAPSADAPSADVSTADAPAADAGTSDVSTAETSSVDTSSADVSTSDNAPGGGAATAAGGRAPSLSESSHGVDSDAPAAHDPSSGADGDAPDADPQASDPDVADSSTDASNPDDAGTNGDGTNGDGTDADGAHGSESPVDAEAATATAAAGAGVAAAAGAGRFPGLHPGATGSSKLTPSTGSSPSNSASAKPGAGGDANGADAASPEGTPAADVPHGDAGTSSPDAGEGSVPGQGASSEAGATENGTTSPSSDASTAPTVDDITSWLGDVNPNYNGDPFDPHSSNCGSCSTAVFDRLSGNGDSVASTSTLGIPEMEAHTGIPQTKMTPDEIRDALIAGGPGSHAVIGIDRASGPGHWFNAYYDGAQVVAIDGQTGHVHGWPPDYGNVVHWDAAVAPADSSAAATGASKPDGGSDATQEAVDESEQRKPESRDGITPERKKYLRRRTPSAAVRNHVNDGVEMVDPVYGYEVTRLEADHIYAYNQIIDLPGFDRLTKEQQLQVVNNLENFIGLGKSSNASKQDKSWSDWAGHSEYGPVPDDVRQAMLRLETKAIAALQDMIDGFLA